MKIPVQPDKVLHGAVQRRHMPLGPPAPQRPVFGRNAGVFGAGQLCPDKLHDGFCRVDDGGIIRIPLIEPAVLPLKTKHELRQAVRLLQVCNVRCACIPADKNTQHGRVVLNSVLLYKRKPGPALVQKRVYLMKAPFEPAVEHGVGKIPPRGVGRIKAVPALRVRGGLLRRVGSGLAGRLDVP